MAGAGIEDSPGNQALVERLLDDLSKLMWTMVWDVANSERWQLAPDEVYAELCLELVKLVSRYNAKSYMELKKISVTSMRNRIRDLASACYLTNRKIESSMKSLDDNEEGEQSDAMIDTFDGAAMYEANYVPGLDNRFDLDEYCEGMTPDARLLVQAIIGPSERVAYFLWLTAQRKHAVGPKGFWTLTVTPLIMTRALGWEPDRLKIAWDEVSLFVNGAPDFGNGLVVKEDDNNGRR